MKNAVRAGFLALLAFEVISWQGILPVRPDYSWIGLMLTALLVWIVLEFLELPGSLGLIVLGDVALDAGSDMFNLYSRIPNWDKFLHLLGGAVVGIVAIYVLWRAIRNGTIRFRNPLVVIAIGAVLIASFLGAIYEAQEMFIDIYNNQQRQLGDGPDTVKDQLFNMGGAAFAACVYALALTPWKLRMTSKRTAAAIRFEPTAKTR